MHSRTAIIVVSDGYDTGDPVRLTAAVRRLRRRARGFVWLNLASIERVLPPLVLALR